MDARAYYSEALNGPVPRVHLVNLTKDAVCMQTEEEANTHGTNK